MDFSKRMTYETKHIIKWPLTSYQIFGFQNMHQENTPIFFCDIPGVMFIYAICTTRGVVWKSCTGNQKAGKNF